MRVLNKTTSYSKPPSLEETTLTNPYPYKGMTAREIQDYVYSGPVTARFIKPMSARFTVTEPRSKLLQNRTTHFFKALQYPRGQKRESVQLIEYKIAEFQSQLNQSAAKIKGNDKTQFKLIAWERYIKTILRNSSLIDETPDFNASNLRRTLPETKELYDAFQKDMECLKYPLEPTSDTSDGSWQELQTQFENLLALMNEYVITPGNAIDKIEKHRHQVLKFDHCTWEIQLKKLDQAEKKLEDFENTIADSDSTIEEFATQNNPLVQLRRYSLIATTDRIRQELVKAQEEVTRMERQQTKTQKS